MSTIGSSAKGRKIGILLVMGGALAAVFLLAFSVGRYPVGPAQVFGVLWGKLFFLDTGITQAITTVVMEVRLPRIIAAVLIGAALAGAGASYQGMCKNPLVSPDILGASAGAGFGAAVAINCSMSVAQIQLAAFAGGMTAVCLAYYLSRYIQYDSILVLVLAGIVISTCFSSGIYLVKYLADPYDKMPAITFWLMGSLSSVTLKEVTVLALPVLAGGGVLLSIRWRLNVLSLDEDEAKTLGLSTGKLRAVVIVCATLMTAAAVATSGMIGWVGLVIPHMARMIIGHDYQVLLPASFLMGGIYLVLIDCLARAALSVEIPLGVLTALLGAPFMVYLMTRLRGGWS